MSRGVKENKQGLESYNNWDLEEAVELFKLAIEADPENAEYHLNLARAYARGGEYHEAIQALGEFIRTETDSNISERYEYLFSSALDAVEEKMIDGMRRMGISIKVIGKAIQMWLEYRIAIGRRPLRIPKPELWAAALAYTAIKVNFSEADKALIAEIYDVTERSLTDKFKELVETLDIMPADFRYFAGDENPLDKLVEAAEIMEALNEQFQED